MNSNMTAEAAAQLQEGIQLVLSRWAALQMAVENQWGGRDSLQKSQQLGINLFHRLCQSKEQVYIDDLEDVLDEFMFSLNTEIEDGSIEEIAENLMIMREECLEGNFNTIKRLKEAVAPRISYVRQAGSIEEDDSEDDDDEILGEDITSEMEVGAPQCMSNNNQKNTISADNSSLEKNIPEVVNEWTVVTSRRNKGRRN